MLLRCVSWLGLIFSVSLQRDLANRSNIGFETMATLFTTLSGLVALKAVYGYTGNLAGWTESAAVVLYGTFLLVSGFVSAFVEPNLSFFQGKVVNGELDEALIKPIPSLLTISIGTCSPLALLQSAAGLIVLVLGWMEYGFDASLFGMMVYVPLLISGIIIAWASRVILACLVFWLPGTEPSVLYNAFWEMGRYPTDLYPRSVRLILTWIVPVSFISTIPAAVLQGKSSTWLPLAGVVAAIVAIVIASRVWTVGLKRYTGAAG